MSTEPTTLMGRTIRAIGAKKVARLWGMSLGYVYAIARDPADPEHPDNTGTDADPDTRRRDLLEAVAAHPLLRPLLREWRLRDEAFYARVLDHDEPMTVTDEQVIRHAASCAKESGEGVQSAIIAAMNSNDPDRWRAAQSEVAQAETELHALGLAITRRLEALEEGVQLRRMVG